MPRKGGKRVRIITFILTTLIEEDPYP